MTIKVILVVRAENDLSTELNVSWADSSSSSATSVSLTLYEPAGNTTATQCATDIAGSNSLHFLLH